LKAWNSRGGVEIFYPKEVMIIPLERNRKIATIRVIINPEAYYKKDILHNLSEIIYNNGINILGVCSSHYLGHEHSYIVFYLDVTDLPQEVLNVISKEMKSLEGIEDVKVYLSPLEGVAIDPGAIPFAMGSRAVILMKHSLRILLTEFNKWGWWSVLNTIGREIGRAAWEDHVRMIGEDINKLLKIAESRFHLSGFGFWETVKADVDLGEFIIRVYGCIECEIGSEINGYTGSHLVRGMIEGWIEKLMGVNNVMGFEAKCIARGDPYCEFHFKIKQK